MFSVPEAFPEIIGQVFIIPVCTYLLQVNGVYLKISVSGDKPGDSDSGLS